jgi:MYXO-CTERM domain-containing protein
VACAAGPAAAADTLKVLEVGVDPPTLIHLGVQVLISDDDDRDARIDLRYRPVGDPAWQGGPTLLRVRPELVTFLAVPDQFAGTAFALRPDTEYELELHAVDPDGLDELHMITARTRPVPRAEPANPVAVAVADAAGLVDALDAAGPGTVISLAAGTYVGPFALGSSGTADDPIVLRGASTDGTILDGGGCPDCNVLEVYGSHVHVERLTLRAANRALRFQGEGAAGNVVRRVRVHDVSLGIGAKADQRDFYLCDNVLEGPLVWPQVYGDDGGMFANVDGIVVQGHGHVVCHNDLIGWGDALKTAQDGARAIDFYGNLTRSAYDNAIELDGSSGNTRAVGNLMINSWSPLSFQPIFGGPAYALRNVAVNIVDEQHKLHANSNTGETVGSLIAHNTFVSPRHAVNLQTGDTTHEFALLGNLYVGPAAPEGGLTVSWSAPIDGATIDGNGWYPDGTFDFDDAGTWASFAEMQASGVFEAGGTLLTAGTFAGGLVAPDSYMPAVPVPDATLAADSPAVDAALGLPGINDRFAGAGPDLGALELGCAAPIFGVRPEGVDEDDPSPGCDGAGTDTDATTDSGASTGDDSTGGSTPATTCASDCGEPPTTGAPTGDAATGGAAATDPGDGCTDPQGSCADDDAAGCGCRGADPGGAWSLLLLAALPRLRRRR